MSELKVYHHELRHNEYDEFYLKYEADKVIEELKAQKAQAEDDCAYWKMCRGNAVNAMHETEEYAMQLYRSDRHHKYKRCLDKAKQCKRNRLNASICGPVMKIDFWEKWRKRWLSLAEKFKECF